MLSRGGPHRGVSKAPDLTRCTRRNIHTFGVHRHGGHYVRFSQMDELQGCTRVQGIGCAEIQYQKPNQCHWRGRPIDLCLCTNCTIGFACVLALGGVTDAVLSRRVANCLSVVGSLVVGYASIPAVGAYHMEEDVFDVLGIGEPQWSIKSHN